MSASGKGTGRTLATLLALAVGLAVLLALRPDRWISPGQAAVSTSPSGTAPDAEPSGLPSSGPPAVWSTLTVEALAGGPIGVTSVVAWSGGYLALGPGPTDLGLTAWTSRNGRAWTELPAGTFGRDIVGAEGVSALGGLLVAVSHPDRSVSAYWSRDGSSWTETSAPRLDVAAGGLAGQAGDVAGSSRGVIGVVAGETSRITFSADGTSWQSAGLPGLNRSRVAAVVAFGDGYLALGSTALPVVAGSGGSTTGVSLDVVVAWWSGDGLTWRAATLDATLAGSVREVHAGAAGLLAVSRSPGTTFTETAWQSTDGRSWAATDAIPVGSVDGGLAGTFQGDGTRILVAGPVQPGNSTGYWASLDGLTWTKLTLGGAGARVVEGATALLLRDGVLFVAGDAAWFGEAAP